MNMDQFFSNWETADSYAALAITLIGFLFGLLIGYLLRGPRMRRLRQELKESNQQLILARQEVGNMKDQMDQKETDWQRINYDLVEMTQRVDKLEEDKAKLYKDIFHANQEVEKHQAAARTYQATIESLNGQITSLEEERDNFASAPAASTVEEEHEERMAFVDNSNSTATEQEIFEETHRRLERFEAKLNQLESENLALKQQMSMLHPSATGLQTKSTPVGSDTLIFDIDDVEEEPELQVTPDKKVLHQKVIAADIEKDDLTRIEGIGPFLQTKLWEMGVYTYAEIASWDTPRIAEVTTKIGYFPGRIEKDDWVGQAWKLYELKKNNPETFNLVLTPSLPDDLKVVEGIGPKIEELLKDAGITNWHELANTQLERLQAILAEAGERYRIHDPGTWAEQALLAAEGKYDQLKQLQEELKGGRKVS